MSTVLLATDGSDLATSAMIRSVELLGRDHEFVALSVVPHAFAPAAAVTPMDAHPLVIDPSLEDEIEEEDKAASAAELRALDDVLGIGARPLIEVGDAGPVICRVAAAVGADVIVVGSHGHGWLQRVFLGSVSQHVLNHAPCPVLVMRLEPRPDDADQGEG